MYITFKKRIFFFFLAVVFFLSMFIVGFSFKMDESFSKELSKNFVNQLGSLNEFGIFFNNLEIALVMFIPVIGIIMGTISGFSTGLVFNSMLNTPGGDVASYSNPLIVFFTPFGILELVSYGIAISRSGILIFEILKREFVKGSFIYLIVEIVLVSGLLFMGAVIEWMMIADSFQ